MNGEEIPEAASEMEFTAAKNPDPPLHMRLGLHPASKSHFFSQNAAIGFLSPAVFDPNKISLRNLPLPVEIADAPLSAYQATSTALQTAYFGIPRPEQLNIQRLQEFCGNPMDIADLETYPHLLA